MNVSLGVLPDTLLQGMPDQNTFPTQGRIICDPEVGTGTKLELPDDLV